MPTTTPHPFAEFFASLDDLADLVADLRETASVEPVDETIEKLAEWITEEEGTPRRRAAHLISLLVTSMWQYSSQCDHGVCICNVCAETCFSENADLIDDDDLETALWIAEVFANVSAITESCGGAQTPDGQVIEIQGGTNIRKSRCRLHSSSH